ncbi:MAG: hypothetical protein AB1505_00600 [Candidatus Latescibacterota bacterium]
MPPDGPRILFEHDGRHPLIYMYEPPMQPEEYEAAVDELVGTPVEALMFCLGDGRTVLHDTRVGELWGHNVERWPHLVFRRAHQNARHLIEQGHDPLRLVCRRAHAKGLRVYPILLVQQGRGPRQTDVRCSQFRFANAHLEIGARGGVAPDWPGFTCLDFVHEEVRQERLALIQEVLTGYEVDGFELQLNYQPWYFHPDRVGEGRPIMTDWVRQVHAAVKASGPGRELAVRVPARPANCREAGLDVEEWIRQGIVDVLIGDAFAGPELLDSTADFRDLVEAARGSSCRVHAALHNHVDSDRLGHATIEMVRAGACNYWTQGVDGLYLAHWFGVWPYRAPFYEALREVPHPEVMAPKDKVYFVPTITGRQPRPPADPGTRRDLPAELEVDRPVTVSFAVSDDLARWGAVGRVHEVLLRLRVMNTTERDQFDFRLNGRELPASSLRRIHEIYRMRAPRYRTGSGYWFVFRLGPEHWPVPGHNCVEATLRTRDAAIIPQAYLRDVELETRYLMGRSFHRAFVDPDLGPYEHATEGVNG